jgi:hypothetical protein
MSQFNRTVKDLLRFLDGCVEDPHKAEVTRLKKLYMTHKREDAESPARLLRPILTEHATAISERDEAYFRERHEELGLDMALWESLTDEQRGTLWSYVGSLHVLANTMEVFDDNTVKSIHGVAERCAAELGDTKGKSKKELMESMMSVTARAMPDLMRSMGVNVSQNDIEEAQRRMMTGDGPLGNLGSLIGNMVEQAQDVEGGEEHDEIQRILG